MKSEKYITLGKRTALTSFIIGALIFGIYFFTSNSDLLPIGYGFIVLAGIVNLLFLVAILVKSKYDSANRKKLLKTSGLMLVNLPVMFLLIWFSQILLDNMRITFTNKTEKELTDINIVGCGGGHIDKLEIGESETVWVPIKVDCSINIDYLSDGQRKEETVAGYVSPSMGQKVNHQIDGTDKYILSERPQPNPLEDSASLK